jgi:mycothiol synthase
VRTGEREAAEWFSRSAGGVIVEDEDGEVCGWGQAVLRGHALSGECLVHPGRTGRGLGSFLLDWSEQQALQHGAEMLHVGARSGDEAAKPLFATRGFQPVRSFYWMLADLTEAPERPGWPDGISVDPLRVDEERLLHEVMEDTFSAHWGHVNRDFEDWRRGHIIEHDLTFLARDGDDVAGVVMCNEDLYGVGLIAILGVRAPWRGRGLGRALLLQGFGALYERGRRTIGLGVDADNETGAVGLYESVGMRIGSRDDLYERRM